jgi:cytochrome P450
MRYSPAITTCYNFYYDIILGGQYLWRIEEMHRRYGPIVRPRPDTVHINDPAFIDKLYTQSPRLRRERYDTILQTIQAPGSILATRDHDMHRRRRAVLNPYFSHQNVRRLVPVINDVLANLLRRMDGWAAQGEPVGMNNPLRAATTDVIREYCFGSGGKKCLDMDDCNAAFFDVILPSRISHLGTHVYWLAKTMANLPAGLMTILLPRVGVFASFVIDLAKQVDVMKKTKDLPEGKTIFHEMLRGDIPEAEKETRRLTDEAMVLVIAGSDTTASTLAAITYHMLSDPKALARLRTELKGVMPEPDTFPDPAALDGLPYLNAVIQETLRLYPGATHRQDRTAPDEDIVYNDGGKTYVIPAGTCIGMTAPLVNRHPDLYPRPDEWLPERYLEDPLLSKHLFTFSKGARQCIGMNLAYQELQSFTAGIFRKYDAYEGQDGPTLELCGTTRDDIAVYADFISPGQVPGSKGLRVRIRR